MSPAERHDLVTYRIVKARETFNEVNVLIKHEFWNTAVNRLYYSCFYAVVSLLLDRGINTTTHAGARQMFGLHFIKTNIIEQNLGRFYSRIFNMRQTGDYDDLIDFDRQKVLELAEPAERLISIIEALLLI